MIASPLLALAGLPAVYLVAQVRMIHWDGLDILTRAVPLGLLLGLAMVYASRLIFRTGRPFATILGLACLLVNLLSLWVWFDRYQFLFNRYCLGT